MTGTRRRVLVLDDDPTGTQSASDVDVYLEPTPATVGEFARSGDDACFVMTNTRSMHVGDATRLIADVVEVARRELGEHLVVLRGDSTLRGHVFEEIESVAGPDSAVVFVPAYPEAGRTTEGGIHYLDIDGVKHPAGTTEFAADPVFGFTSSSLGEWTTERSGGRWTAMLVPARDGRLVVDDVVGALGASGDRELVVPDVATNADVGVVAEAIDLVGRRRDVVVRTAAPLAARLAGTAPRAVSVPRSQRTLLVCGSHTSAATRQLAELGADAIVLPTDVIMQGDHQLIDRVVGAVGSALAGGLAVLTTERHRRSEHSTLDDGAAVMAALCSVVARVAPEVDLLVTKGGITSADVARFGVGARRARVLGQAETGVPVWRHHHRAITQIVVPGNVGDDGTLARIVRAASCG